MYLNKWKGIHLGLVLFLFAILALFNTSCRNPTSTPQLYTITFDANGGTIPGSGRVKYRLAERGERLSPVASPTNTGSRFLGWFVSTCNEDECDCPEYMWRFDESTVWGDITLHARWGRASGGGGGSGGGRLPGGGGGSGGGSGGDGGGPTVTEIRAPEGLNVHKQLQWLHDPAYPDRVQGGADRVYIVTARNPGADNIPGDNIYHINFVAPNNAHVYVRIESDDPNTSRDIQLIGSAGVMLNVENGNTLTLLNVNLVGMTSNSNPLIIVDGGGTLKMTNSAVRDNGGVGVRVNGGTMTMDTGAQVRDNLRHGVELVGSTAILIMTNAQITGNGSALNAAPLPANQAIPASYMGSAVRVNNGTFVMREGAVVQGLTDNMKPLVYISNGGLLEMTGTVTNRAVIRNSGISYNPTVRNRPYNLDIGGGRGVFVTAGGTIEMNTGARIYGHGNGGVLLSGSSVTPPLNHATLIMRGDSRIEYNAARGPAGNILQIIAADFNRRSGGGVSSTDGTIRMYDDARIANNITTTGDLGGGGVLLMSTSRLYMNDNAAINGNATTGNAGAVHIRGDASRLIMRDNSALYDNRGGEGGAIRIQDTARVYMHNNASIHGDNRGSRTGGIELHGNSVLIMHDNTNISGNFLVNGNAAPQVFINGAWTHRERDFSSGLTYPHSFPPSDHPNPPTQSPASGNGIIRMSGGSIIPNGGCNTNPSVQIGLFGVYIPPPPTPPPSPTVADFFVFYPSYTIVRFGVLNPATGLLNAHNGFISVTNALLYTSCIIVNSSTQLRVVACGC